MCLLGNETVEGGGVFRDPVKVEGYRKAAEGMLRRESPHPLIGTSHNEPSN